MNNTVDSNEKHIQSFSRYEFKYILKKSLSDKIENESKYFMQRDSHTNKDLGNRWDQLRTVRQVCNVAIEVKRTNKELGSSLEADLEIFLEKKYFDLVKNIDLSEFCITSKAKVQILDGQKDLKLFKLENIQGIEVLVKKAIGNKCPRCWKVFEKSCNRCENAKIT